MSDEEKRSRGFSLTEAWSNLREKPLDISDFEAKDVKSELPKKATSVFKPDLEDECTRAKDHRNRIGAPTARNRR